MENFDWKNPDYTSIYAERQRRLINLRANPQTIPALKLFYKSNIAQFISDWGITNDPKNIEIGLPVMVPFILFPRQADWVDWVLQHWQDQKSALTEKTRQMGFSWLSMATACSICLFYPGAVIGVGSRKQEYVDVIGDPKSLIQKARIFMSMLPVEFRGGWNEDCAPHMRMRFPENGSSITGEAGDNIGRGNTTSIYFVDESAFLERPNLIESSLSQTTNCRIDISTPNGMANPFAEKRHSGKFDVFTFHWRDDPRKTQEWYDKQVRELDSVTIAQEIDINYSASVEGILIPSEWVQAAIDADIKLVISPSGVRKGALDVADEGKDENAFAGRFGIVLDHLEGWKGKGSDIFETVERAFLICDTLRYKQFDYDADGLGAGVRGDARVINERREEQGTHQIIVTAFQGSGAVDKPEVQDKVSGRKNKDMFANKKAQSYWSLRRRFQLTYRAITEKILPENIDDLISIPSNLQNLNQLCVELSQPTYSLNGAGKILINKAPYGSKSPNFADAVNEVFSSSVIPLSEKDKRRDRINEYVPSDSTMGHLG